MASGNTDDFGFDEILSSLEPREEPSVSSNSRKLKKKKKKLLKINKVGKRPVKKPRRSHSSVDSFGERFDDDFEIVQEKIELERWDPNYETFSKVFDAYKIPENLLNVPKRRKKVADNIDPDATDSSVCETPQSFEESELLTDEESVKLSNRKFKEKYRMSVAQLKQCVKYPEIVEQHDVNSKEPRLLVYLKSYRNSVPIPKHWAQKRKYLQGKRGFVKPPFDLPDFIKATGIMEMRQAYQDKDNTSTLKMQMRHKIRPKLGRVDVDYQKLHDAFFKYQTKPVMSMHGDLYYEGKEFEAHLRGKKPGDLSDELRIALGMPVGMNKQLVPPPWLIAMQRYGPPPAYPNIKIPGLNAPLPDGATFGYHVGGWGKPPVDESGKPLYGDVFGIEVTRPTIHLINYNVDKTVWGEVESDESDVEIDEREEEMDDIVPEENPDEGLVTPSGVDTTTAGLQTPNEMEVRKKKEAEETEELTNTLIKKTLYKILPQKKMGNLQGSLFNPEHTYDIQADEKQDDGTSTMGIESSVKTNAEITDETFGEDSVTEGMLSKTTVKSAATKKGTKSKEGSKSTKKYKEFKF